MATRHWLPSLWNDERRTEPLGRLHREIDRMFDEFLGSSRHAAAADSGIVMAPRMDMAETDDSIEITAELPGVDEKDLDVSVEGDVLTIKGEKKSASEEKKKDYHVVERSYGSFRRSIRLPGVVEGQRGLQQGCSQGHSAEAARVQAEPAAHRSEVVHIMVRPGARIEGADAVRVRGLSSAVLVGSNCGAGTRDCE